MKIDRFAPYDDDDGIDFTGIGITLDDLNLDDLPDDHRNDLETLLMQRQRWQKPKWYHTSYAEEHHCNVPPFNSAADRARYFIEAMARVYLDKIDASDDDKVLPYRDAMVSLNDLLDVIDDDQIRQSVDWNDIISDNSLNNQGDT